MTSSTTIILRSALNVNKYMNRKNSPVSMGDERMTQYIQGLERFFSFNYSLYDINFMLVDNTIKYNTEFPKEITDVLPDSVKLVATGTNKFGVYNKGAGDIETMRALFSKNLIATEFFFHFEARLFLEDPSFLFNFLDRPRSIICIELLDGLAKTGYFGANSYEFSVFAKKVSLPKMCLRSISIEYLLYHHAISHTWELHKNSGFCIRHDPLRGSVSY